MSLPQRIRSNNWAWPYINSFIYNESTQKQTVNKEIHFKTLQTSIIYILDRPSKKQQCVLVLQQTYALTFTRYSPVNFLEAQNVNGIQGLASFRPLSLLATQLTIVVTSNRVPIESQANTKPDSHAIQGAPQNKCLFHNTFSV